jgi:serralysin
VLRRTLRPALAVLAAAAVVTTTVGTAAGVADAAESPAGPSYDFTTELMGQFRFIPLKDVAMLTRTEHGYRFRTGQQDSHLVITQVQGGLRFVDTGTKSFKRLGRACRPEKVRVGVAAVCRMPATVSTSRPLLVEVWPRLGDDFTDGSTLPATVALAVLGDEGHDVARLGAGPDFFNGHSGRDRVSGGAGNDWIRAGSGNDTVWGGPGDDKIVGMEGHDVLLGGEGDDRVGGLEGDDRLWGGAGADFILCGTGRDSAKVDDSDRLLGDCELTERG